MELNTKYVQVRGKIETDKVLKHGDDIAVVVSVTDVTEKDNQDGTFDIIYKAKLFEAE